MKKKIAYVIVGVLLILLCACSYNSQFGIDRTVKINTFVVPDDALFVNVDAQYDLSRIYRNADELCENAEYIVYGEVKRVFFSDDDARPCIYYDFAIIEVYRGPFNDNDTLTISEYGGYVRGTVWEEVYGKGRFEIPLSENVVFSYSFYGAPQPAIGEHYVLFLGDDNICEGAYTPYGVFMGKYLVLGETVRRYVPDSDAWLYDMTNTTNRDQETLAEIISAVRMTPLRSSDSD